MKVTMASQIDGSLAPGFLIASPKLDGSPFERAVIVMVHHDDQGAMGFIVNKPLDIDFGSLLESVQEDEYASRAIADGCFDVFVHFGGPVRVEQLWVIYNHDGVPFEPDNDHGMISFGGTWTLVASSDSIEAFAFGERVNAFLPFIGYTGWGPGQLEGELEEGSWLCLDFQDDLVLDQDADGEDIWAEALGRLGVHPMAFLMMSKVGEA
ncbi:MAG: YqgE/AlgH family protein [Myxococcota bacterium]